MRHFALCPRANRADRDPASSWVKGPVVWMGDPAHPMHPAGSNGASQAFIDVRILGAKFIQHGVSAAMLKAHDDALCSFVSEIMLRNRANGPFGLLNLLNDRCEGIFGDIGDVVTRDERAALMAGY